jgi:hypothetical protein
MVKLKTLLEAAPIGKDPAAIAAPAEQPAAPPTPPPAAQPSGQDSAAEYSPAFDFNDFETRLAQATETAKNNFQEKLMQKVGGKKVMIRASKGYGQPKKDYTINVTGVSIDFYYERYVVIFKDEKDKEYFLETGMKIKILGPAEAKPANKANKSSAPTPAPQAGQKPAPAPQEPQPNTATQGL